MNRHPVFSLVCASLVLLAGTGCKKFATLGSGTHMDAPRDRTTAPVDNRRREMIVEVTTDPEGNVAEIHFQRSSGKESLDAYIAESIRQGWPRQPSMKSVAAITYSVEKGFSEPKVISNTPLR